jgi:hypothetical protein
MDNSCPICFEEFAGNKYEINCGAKSKHVICNSCESTLRLATRPEYRVRKGQTTRQIKCPMCRGVETVENPRSVESYKAELESLYGLLNPARVAPAPVAHYARLLDIRQTAQANRTARLEREQLRRVLRQSLVAPVAAPASPAAAAAPAAALDTGDRSIWCVHKRNGAVCNTKGKTKRKCNILLPDGTNCFEKVCRSCAICHRH